MLVRQLPPEAALWRAIDPDRTPWGLTEQLLAAAVDHLATANWQRLQIHSDKARNVPPPDQIARPGVEPTGKDEQHFGGKGMSRAELRAQLRARTRALEEAT